MSSPDSDPSMSPSPRPAVDRPQAAPAAPCNPCDKVTRDTDDSPMAEETIANAASTNKPRFCGHCRSSSHYTVTCPRTTCADRELRLHSLEPFARAVLKNGVPKNAPCCSKHAQFDHSQLTRDLGWILQHRALMPMCVRCASKEQSELDLKFEVDFRGSLDSCHCAAFVFDNDVCQWCAVEELIKRCRDYMSVNTIKLGPDPGKSVSYLRCECRKAPMGTSYGASSSPLLVREVLRLCAGCTGVVNVPLHHLNGESHLSCIPGTPSRALLDEHGIVAKSVEAPLVGMNDTETCIGHPVRIVAQRIVAVKHKDKRRESAGRLPGSGDTGLRSQASGGTTTQSDASRGVVTRPHASGGSSTRSHASGGVAMPLQASGGSAKRSSVLDGTPSTQQQQAPVALMVPSTPTHFSSDGREKNNATGQLNQGFRFPK
ncbi:uncharacterized protein RCC_04505 [Ramularia collo-cygni]|uniref:Uncharacterized protein n=1 Tax=Ramularia collo-cygni TaxID=112498 RepID=A0A2D3URK5_9PEZI|nr:uncharacterized protein RCC_04505 [Ramularia collo-cygni]CZT18661.1 uncharacterized protein RCC_04505 [Ramularia collo-cygni]